MARVDDYIQKVIQLGDDGSRLLAALTAPTLRNSPYVEILTSGMGGMSVLRIPDGYRIVVHSAAGEQSGDVRSHTASFVQSMVEQANAMGITPLGFANVIDANNGDLALIREIGQELAAQATRYKISIMNGELAILGDRIKGDANVSGTMISMVPKRNIVADIGIPYAIFDSSGGAVFINSDGVGTKTEFYERAGSYAGALRDSIAMKADDAAKKGAVARVFSDVVETKGRIPLLNVAAHRIGEEIGADYFLYEHDASDSLLGWTEAAPAFNVSGSVVSTIDEHRLNNPPAARDGDYLIAIRGKPNPRSNGITDKRKAMVKQFGNNWHTTPEGRMFLEFLAEPSTIFYPLFRELIEQGYVTNVFHMSGGAYNGKLARPLASSGLYARIDSDKMFPADWRELALAGFSLTPPETAYAKWPMGNEGFVSTYMPERALETIEAYGLEGRLVGRLQKAQNGRTGVELAGIKGSDGKDVYFSGK